MKLLKSILIFIAFFAIIYLFLAFYTCEINFTKWSEVVRFAQVYIGGVCGLVISVAFYSIKH